MSEGTSQKLTGSQKRKATHPSHSPITHVTDPQQTLNDILSMTTPRINGASGSRPLVALLDGRDCTVEMPILKDVATVAFCDAQSTQEIHEKVLNEAVAALMYHSIKLEKEDLEKFKLLRVVFRIGSGIDNIDVKAATELGIAVCHAPGDYVEEVADFTLSLILNLYRRTFWHAKAFIESRKAISADQVRETASGSKKMRGSVLGLLGCGRVGTAVGLRAKAFGMTVVFYDPFVKEGLDKALGFERVFSYEDFFNRVDCISLHCPLADDTRQVINSDTLKQCKPGVFIVNTSRPGLICESDLAAALKNGHVKGAALDVHENAPYDANILNPLLGCPNIINTPHAAWLNETSCKELRAQAAKEVRKAITGRCPNDLGFCINKEALMQNGHANNQRRASSAHNNLLNMSNFGFPGLSNFPQMSMSPHFPYGNPLLAMGAQMGALNPLLLNNPALAQFNPAAALSSLAAAQAAHAQRTSPTNPSSHSSPSPHTNKSSVSPSLNGGSGKTDPSSPSVKIEAKEETEENGNAESSSTNGDSGSESNGVNKKSISSTDENCEMDLIDAEKLKEDLNIGELDQPEEITVGLNGNRVNIPDTENLPT
ncbi:unnamed protein product [Caenorhabditis angaria]|uniref:C-terminal-binding protein n=1 Tax=Caenorhabditis angaria TaxID=860376 RepID=A0A9P1N8P5_9PELO|nr:unnamed protein product [Caenorhabditis angaria]